MKWNPARGRYEFTSSDRVIHAPAGALGLTLDGRMTHGFSMETANDNPDFEELRYPMIERLTMDERREIAELMVARWKKWADTGFQGPCVDHQHVHPCRVPGIQRTLCGCGRFDSLS